MCKMSHKSTFVLWLVFLIALNWSSQIAEAGSQSTGSSPQSTGSSLQRTESGSQGTEFGSQGTEFGSQGTEFGSQGTEFGSQGTEFGSQRTESGAQSADRCRQSTEIEDLSRGAQPLPRKNVQAASECLQKYMGDSFVPPYFKGNLTYGEYLGSFCKEEDVESIEKKVTQDGKGHGKEVQNCLIAKEMGPAYNQFYDLGTKQIKEAEKIEQKIEERAAADDEDSLLPILNFHSSEVEMDTESNDDKEDDLIPADTQTNKKNTQSQSHEWSPIKETPSIDDKAAAQVSTSKYQKQSGAQIDQAFKQDQTNDELEEGEIPLTKIKLSDLTKLSLGLCFALPRFKFDDLKDDKDKKETYECLVSCTTAFLQRIQHILNEQRFRIIDEMEKRDPELPSKQNAIDGKGKPPYQTEIDTDTKKKRKRDETASEQIEPSKRIKTADSIVFHNKMEEFKTRTEIEEIKNAFVQVLQRIISAKMADDQNKNATETKYDKSIETLTTAGMKFLNRYAEIFAGLNEYLDENDKEPDENLELALADQTQDPDVTMGEEEEASKDVTMGEEEEGEISEDVKKDEKGKAVKDVKMNKEVEAFYDKLKNAFFFYKSCSKNECLMANSKSIPMEEAIDNITKSIDLQQLDQSVLAMKKFFRILTGQYDDDDDNDYDED